MSKGYEILSLDELDSYPGAGASPTIHPLRRRLGFRAFGLNCWSASAVGRHVIQPHAEQGGDEELYVVVRGRASFTVDGETADAPAGTLVHVLPDTRREAVAEEDRTLVLAIGATIGETYKPAAWEDFSIAFSMAREGRVGEGRALATRAMNSDPDAWQGHYNLACYEALAGDADAAFKHLRAAVERGRDDVTRYATDDTDFDTLRADPRWTELFA